GGDSEAAAGYNISSVESAGRQLDSADAAAEGRAAMDRFSFETAEPIGTAPTWEGEAPAEPEPPFADPFVAFTNPLAADYFGLAGLAFGDTTAAGSASSSGTVDAGGGGAYPASSTGS